jgi:signal peptidase II
MSTESPPPPTSACVRRFGAALLPAVATVVLLADQASKLWVQQHFAACDATSLPIVPGWVAFAYTCNKGAAFGLLANETLLFVLIALVIIGVLVAYVRFLPAHRPWLRLSLGLQLGGALGNLLDRLRQGYVVDFISVQAWPVFNIADACVVVGVLILAYHLLLVQSQAPLSNQQLASGQPEPGPWPSRDENAGTAAPRNLTWAIAMVIVSTLLAIALVYVLHSLMI